MLPSSSAIKIEIVDVKGSTPRGVGACMFVSRTEQSGTIGGGALEFGAIAHARQLLDRLASHDITTIALGPEINQCCGGRVKLQYTSCEWPNLKQEAACSKNEVYVFGAGHTGAAIAKQFSLIGWYVHLIDDRAEWLDKLGSIENVDRRREALPESVVKQAPSGSVFIITTYSHDLDFAITAAALERRDAAYTGMIGSRTKRERFRRWAEAIGVAFPDEQLRCPMGETLLDSKAPEIIALSVASQVISKFAQSASER